MPQDDRPISLEEFEENRRKHYGLPKGLTESLKTQESDGRQYDKSGVLTSRKQAKGRYQVLQSTADKYSLNVDDPYENVEASFRYLSDLHKQVDAKVADPGERWAQTLAGYHAGERRLRKVNRTGVLPSTSDGHIRTDDYVDAIMKRWQQNDQGGSGAPAQPQAAEGMQFDLRTPKPAYPNAGTGDLVPPKPARPMSSRDLRLAADETARRNATPVIAGMVEAFEALKREGSVDAARSVAAKIKKQYGQWMEVGEGDGWPYVKSKVRGWHPVQPAAGPSTPSLADQQAEFARRPLLEQWGERAVDAYARGGGQLSKIARQTYGMAAGAVLAPQRDKFEFVNAPEWRAGEEARFRALEERRQARPSSFASEVGEGIIEGVPVAAGALGAGLLTGGGALATIGMGAGIGAAGADWKDPKRAVTQTVLGGVAPYVGGRAGAAAAGRVASRLASPALRATTRGAGEIVGGGGANIAQSAIEQAAFEGRISPRELAKSGIIGAGLSAPGAAMAARAGRAVTPPVVAYRAMIEAAAAPPVAAPRISVQKAAGAARAAERTAQTQARLPRIPGDTGLQTVQDYTSRIAEIEQAIPEGPQRQAAMEQARQEYRTARRAGLPEDVQSRLAQPDTRFFPQQRTPEGAILSQPSPLAGRRLLPPAVGEEIIPTERLSRVVREVVARPDPRFTPRPSVEEPMAKTPVASQETPQPAQPATPPPIPAVNQRLIQRTQAKAEELIKQGQFDDAISELKAHQQALRDAKTQAGRAPGKAPGMRSSIERQIGQAGNRIGQVRKMKQEAGRQRKQVEAAPTADIPAVRTPVARGLSRQVEQPMPAVAADAITGEIAQTPPISRDLTNRITEGEGAELPPGVSRPLEGQPIELPGPRRPRTERLPVPRRATDENINQLRARAEELGKLAYYQRGDFTGDLRDEYSQLNSAIRVYENEQARTALGGRLEDAPPPGTRPGQTVPPAGEREARRVAIQQPPANIPEASTPGRKVTQEVQLPPGLKPSESFASREDARQGHFEQFDDAELVGEIRRLEDVRNMAIRGRSRLTPAELEANNFDLKVAVEMQKERGRIQRGQGREPEERIEPRTPGRSFKREQAEAAQPSERVGAAPETAATQQPRSVLPAFAQGAWLATPEGARTIEQSRQALKDAIDDTYASPKDKAAAIAKARAVVQETAANVNVEARERLRERGVALTSQEPIKAPQNPKPLRRPTTKTPAQGRTPTFETTGRAMGAREQSAANNMIETIMSLGDMSRPSALRVFDRYQRDKLFDTSDASIGGQLRVKRGDLLDRDVLRRAALDVAEQPQPEAPPAETGRKIQHSQFGAVTEAVDQSGVRKGQLRVLDGEGKPHVIKNPRVSGGNKEAAFAKAEPKFEIPAEAMPELRARPGPQFARTVAPRPGAPRDRIAIPDDAMLELRRPDAPPSPLAHARKEDKGTIFGSGLGGLQGLFDRGGKPSRVNLPGGLNLAPDQSGVRAGFLRVTDAAGKTNIIQQPRGFRTPQPAQTGRAQLLSKPAAPRSPTATQAKQSVGSAIVSTAKLPSRKQISETVGGVQMAAQLGNPRFVVRNVLQHVVFGKQERTATRLAAALDWAYSKASGKPRQITAPKGSDLASYARNWSKAVEAYKKGDPLPGQPNVDYITADANKLDKAVGKLMTWINEIPDAAQWQTRFEQSLQSITNAAKKSKAPLDVDAAIDQATMEANRASLRDPNFVSVALLKIKQGLNTASSPVFGTDKFGAGDFVLKYAQTPGALLKRGLERSPLGLFQVAKEAATPGPFRRRNTLLALSRVAEGAATGAGLGAALAAGGILIGPEEESRTGKAMEREEGVRGYSFNSSALRRLLTGDLTEMREGDTLYSIDWLQPWAMNLSAGAALYNLHKDGKLGAKSGVKATGEAVYDSLAKTLDVMGDQSVLKNLSRYLSRAQGETFADKFLNLTKAVGLDVPSSFVPSSLRSARQVVDPFERDTRPEDRTGVRGFVSEAKNRALAQLPGVSQRFPARPSLLTGQDKKTPLGELSVPARIAAQFSPANISTYMPQPVAREIGRLNRAGEKVSVSFPRLIVEKKTGKHEPASALREKDRRFAEAFARMSGEMIQEPLYQDVDDQTKAAAFDALKRHLSALEKGEDEEKIAVEIVEAAMEAVEKRREKETQ